MILTYFLLNILKNNRRTRFKIEARYLLMRRCHNFDTKQNDHANYTFRKEDY